MTEPRIAPEHSPTAYRPDLDGMRAIAVGGVIVYHLFASALPGGYLGVDVFFVLSGFFITSILWRELRQGTFSLARFYERRIRRILPALLLVLLTTMAASTLILLPYDLLGFARSAFAALGFVANVYFWRDTNYFSRAAEEKPLLHVWSLGVEEQFYVLFPLLLAWLARRNPGLVLPVIAGLGGLSLLASLAAPMVGAALPAFYLLPTRAWELGAGAMLAVMPLSPTRWRGALGLIGLAAVSIALFAGKSAPALAAMLAVGGTMLVIRAAGVGPAGRLLSSSPAVALGLISYSLYLWHWPIIVLAKYHLVRDLDASEAGIAILAMFTAAWLSWRYVERPFRDRAMPASRMLRWVAGGAIVAAAGAAAILWQQGLPGRLPPEAARLNASVGTNYRCPLTHYLHFAGSRACDLGLPNGDPAAADIVLFGNSHAQMYAPVVRDVARRMEHPALLVPMNGCTPTVGWNIDASCRGLAERNLLAILDLPAKVIVLATTWPAGPAQERFLEGLDAAIGQIMAAGKRVVLVGPLATPQWDVASTVSRAVAFGRPVPGPLSVPQSVFDARYGAALARFANRPGIILVQPQLGQCDGTHCYYVRDGYALFADSNHLAEPQLWRFEPLLAAALGSP